MERNQEAPSQSARPTGNVSAAQAELNQIIEDNPVGSAGYRKASVQARVKQLTERIHGTGEIVGRNGRTA